MFQTWIIYSVIVLVAAIASLLVNRKLQLRQVSVHYQGLMMFLLPFLGYSIWAIFQPENIMISFFEIIEISLAAIIFVQIGTLFMLKAMSLARNPGYAISLSQTSVITATILSVVIFNSLFSAINFLSILFIIVFSALIFDKKSRVQEKTSKISWYWYALIGGVLVSGYTLSSKYFIMQDISLLARLFYSFGAMTIAQIIYLLWSKPKLSLNVFDGSLLIISGIVTLVFNIFFQLGLQFAPNPGFMNAVNSSSVVPVTLLSAYLYKDELSLKKIIGILGVFGGLLGLFFLN